ncbi:MULTISPECIES: helix-turn-helix transcriptional regulator [Photorhabdus]|nr:helix-turn-helix transcriptional regulator [Photorhabdus asymbiotica]RKS59751.1 regulatory LuxR family protein [Photorhabdus asymbiotica]
MKRLSIISACEMTRKAFLYLLTPHVDVLHTYSSPSEFTAATDEPYDFMLLDICNRNQEWLSEIIGFCQQYHWLLSDWHLGLLIDPSCATNRIITEQLGTHNVFNLNQPVQALHDECLAWIQENDERPTHPAVPVTGLSEAEQQVIQATLQGLPITTIAKLRGVDAKTIYTQRRAAIKKLGFKNIQELWRIEWWQR